MNTPSPLRKKKFFFVCFHWEHFAFDISFSNLSVFIFYLIPFTLKKLFFPLYSCIHNHLHPHTKFFLTFSISIIYFYLPFSIIHLDDEQFSASPACQNQYSDSWLLKSWFWKADGSRELFSTPSYLFHLSRDFFKPLSHKPIFNPCT